MCVRGTIPVWKACGYVHGSMEELVRYIVAAETLSEVEDLTGDPHARKIEGAFFNGAGPRVLEEL